MKTVLSVRLDPRLAERLRAWARDRGRDVSSAARELVEGGIILAGLREYRAGKLSLGGLAERLGVPLAEAMDLLADLGVPSPVEYADYLRGLPTAARLLRKRRR